MLKPVIKDYNTQLRLVSGHSVQTFNTVNTHGNWRFWEDALHHPRLVTRLPPIMGLRNPEEL